MTQQSYMAQSEHIGFGEIKKLAIYRRESIGLSGSSRLRYDGLDRDASLLNACSMSLQSAPVARPVMIAELAPVASSVMIGSFVMVEMAGLVAVSHLAARAAPVAIDAVVQNPVTAVLAVDLEADEQLGVGIQAHGQGPKLGCALARQA